MSTREHEPRSWARRGPTVPAPPQRALARKMRKEPTRAEQKLWLHLRRNLPMAGSHFQRQVRIEPYIVDFCCHAARLVIELDGGQHATPSQAEVKRTRTIEAKGYCIMRFWNNEVLENTEGVLSMVLEALSASTATPDPSPQGGGEPTARYG